jgi:hypothetical protein
MAEAASPDKTRGFELRARNVARISHCHVDIECRSRFGLVNLKGYAPNDRIRDLCLGENPSKS